MKIKTFFILSLCIPYLCWISIKAISAITIPAGFDNSPSLQLIPKFLDFINFVFVSTIWGWGIPYTVLVVGLLIWSRNKSNRKIYMAAFYSPLFLPFLVVIEILMSLLLMPVLSGAQSFRDNPLILLLVTPVIFIYAAIVVTPLGYIFVGFGVLLFKLLVRLGIIEVDGESLPSVSSMVFRSFREIYNDLTSP